MECFVHLFYYHTYPAAYDDRKCSIVCKRNILLFTEKLKYCRYLDKKPETK